MKNVPRKYVKKWIVQDIGGEPMLILTVRDMTNQELAEAMSYWVEKEDFEYCEELLAEADFRGITLNKRKVRKDANK